MQKKKKMDKEKWHEIFMADCDEEPFGSENNEVFSGNSEIIIDTSVYPNKLAEEKWNDR